MRYEKNRKREEYEKEWESTEAYAISQDIENFTVGERALVRWFCKRIIVKYSECNTSTYLLEDLERKVFQFLIELGIVHSNIMKIVHRNLGTYVDAFIDHTTGKLEKKIIEKGYRYDLVASRSAVSL